MRRQIETYHPFAVRDDCLAVLLAATVDEIRAAAVTVAETERFMRRIRVCHACDRTVELTSRD